MNQTTKSEVKDRIFFLYKNVKYLREKNGLSAKQMASIINIKEKYLTLSENCIDFGYFNDEHFFKNGKDFGTAVLPEKKFNIF